MIEDRRGLCFFSKMVRVQLRKKVMFQQGLERRWLREQAKSVSEGMVFWRNPAGKRPCGRGMP